MLGQGEQPADSLSLADQHWRHWLDPLIDLLGDWRALVRSRELLLLPLAMAAGAFAGVAVSAMSWASQWAHMIIYGIPLDVRLSATASVNRTTVLIAPALGGLILGLMEWYRRRQKLAPVVDPIAANALRGGHLSLGDSVIVSAQTLISNGCGASVGLEAGYAQIGAGIASRLGRFFNLRRNDLRLFLGCGVAGAIGAAFNAPLTGALYACELVIGGYSVRSAGPVLISALVAALVTAGLGGHPYSLAVTIAQGTTWRQTVALAALAIAAGVIAIGVMFASGKVEQAFRWRWLPVWAKPAVGGLLVGALALQTPQVLAAGHGAMALDLTLGLSIAALMMLVVLKSAACIISLGSGFRGGLFFASLFIGSLLGKIYGLILLDFPQTAALHLNPIASALIGMAAFGTAIVGGPLTMTFLVLEMTQNFQVAAAALPASIVANIFVRSTFGHSFSTWRLHLQGEDIQSAEDIGWLRQLTVGAMMRTDIATVSMFLTQEECRQGFPLGSHQAIFLTDAADRYAGMVFLWELHARAVEPDTAMQPVLLLARAGEHTLSPNMDVRSAMQRLEQAQADLLAVTDAQARIIGFLTEAYARKRYMQELDGATDNATRLGTATAHS